MRLPILNCIDTHPVSCINGVSSKKPGFSTRRGFTLLEVVLALGIGLVLLAGLYFGMNIEMRQADTGRELVHRANVARNVFNKFTADVNPHVGPVSPWLQSKFSSSAGTPSSSSPTTTNSTTNNTTNSNTTNSNTSNTMADSTGQTQQSTTDQGQAFKFYGLGQSVYVATSRFPRELRQGLTVSDLRKVYWWIVTDGPVTGLARREVTAVTAAEENPDPTTLDNQSQYVIVPEVRDVSFEYWSGTDWLTEWDGDAYGADGMTPQGPPAAIRITLKMVVRPARGDQSEMVQDFQHVVPLPTANIVQPDGSVPTTGMNP
jgi:prepilin-type N-terminal cleavage/methylation domain-containing protein